MGVLLRVGQAGVAMGSCSLKTVQDIKLEQVALGTGSLVKLSLFLVGIVFGREGYFCSYNTTDRLSKAI